MRMTVRTKVEGIHKWPEAPAPVAFLRHPHRHVFRVTLTLPVSHEHRELEFFMVKAELDTMLQQVSEPYHFTNPTLRDFGTSSCETIAKAVLGWVKTKFSPAGPIEVDVQEDDESSASATWDN